MSGSNRRDPITIQQLDPSKEPNELGEIANSVDADWLAYFQCMAEVLVQGTRDFVKAGYAAADCTHVIRVPYSTETAAVTALRFRIILQVTGEKLHIKEAYRRNQMTREIEITAVN